MNQIPQTLTLDLTTLSMLSFRVTSTAVSLAAIVLFSWPVTGSRLLEIAAEELRRQISKNSSKIRQVTSFESRRGEAGKQSSRGCRALAPQFSYVGFAIFILLLPGLTSSLKWEELHFLWKQLNDSWNRVEGKRSRMCAKNKNNRIVAKSNKK